MAGTLMVPMSFAAIDAGVFIAVGWSLAGFVPPLDGLVIACLLLLLTVGTFAAIGILSATVIILTKRGDPFSSLVLLVSSLLAGAVFPVAVLPDWLQAIARLVPAFYGLSGMREVLLAGGGLSEVAGDIAILTLFNIVLLPLSLFAMSRAIRIGRVTGTLGNR
jgi:ABC-2 type transport system permease protein